MKFVASSDWHADWTTCGVPRFEDVEMAVHQSVDVAIKEEVDAYFFCGDLCDPEDGQAMTKAVCLAMSVANRLKSRKIPFYLIPGNHDVFDDGSGLSTLSPLGSFLYPSACLCSVPGAYDVPDNKFNVLALPFMSPTHPEADRSTVLSLLAPGQMTIVLSHLSVPGIQPGEETTEMPRGRDVAFPFDLVASVPGEKIILQGHYHRRQDFVHQPSGMTIHVVGSIARLTFGEESNEPSFLLFEV